MWGRREERRGGGDFAKGKEGPLSQRWGVLGGGGGGDLGSGRGLRWVHGLGPCTSPSLGPPNFI
jgi:hypothetical protein